MEVFLTPLPGRAAVSGYAGRTETLDQGMVRRSHAPMRTLRLKRGSKDSRKRHSRCSADVNAIMELLRTPLDGALLNDNKQVVELRFYPVQSSVLFVSVIKLLLILFLRLFRSVQSWKAKPMIVYIVVAYHSTGYLFKRRESYPEICEVYSTWDAASKEADKMNSLPEKCPNASQWSFARFHVLAWEVDKGPILCSDAEELESDEKSPPE